MIGNKNIIVFTQWGYDEGLIQSYTLPYLKIIHKISPESKIFLVTQEKRGLEINKERLNSIGKCLANDNIYLLPEKYYRLGLIKIFSGLFNIIKHIGIIRKKKIDFIHTFCTPAGGYGYLISKITKKKLIVDSYEPHSEYMKEAKVWNENGLTYKIVRFLEKKQAINATHLIATTQSMIGYTEDKFKISLKNFYIKPACVDLCRFSYNAQDSFEVRNQLQLNDKIICVYAGKFGDFYLKEEVFDFFKSAYNYWGNRFHALILSDLSETELVNLANKYFLKRELFTLMMVPYNEVPKYLSSADFAISAYRPGFSKKFCTPIKNGEYWAIGLPIVIPNGISIDSEIINSNGIGYVLNDLTSKEYDNAIYIIDKLISTDREALRKNIRDVAIKERSYYIAENIYVKIYGRTSFPGDKKEYNKKDSSL